MFEKHKWGSPLIHSVVMSVQTAESYFHRSGLAITTRWENFSIDLIGIFSLQLIWFFLFCRPLSWIVCYCKCLKCVRLYRPDSVVFSALATATINTYRRVASMLLKSQHYIGQFSHGQESSSLPRVHWVQMPLPWCLKLIAQLKLFIF